ncbi:response regulator, partial [Rhizobium johnstonii]|uniref:response regulator n=1 Tax=Rhizobium johnstonii TaxID=3019933 RepID=UPI003F95CC99
GSAVKILVVDDEPPIRKLLRVGLTAQGYEVQEAPNAIAARQSVTDDMPDLIVLDLGDNFISLPSTLTMRLTRSIDN